MPISPLSSNYREAWKQYQEWADAHIEPDRRPPIQIMADIEALYRALPEHIRAIDPDPEKKGVQEMYRGFARLQALYERTLTA